MPKVWGQMMMMPFVGADWDRLQSLLPHVKKMQEEMGTQVRVYRFSGKEDITDQVL